MKDRFPLAERMQWKSRDKLLLAEIAVVTLLGISYCLTTAQAEEQKLSDEEKEEIRKAIELYREEQFLESLEVESKGLFVRNRFGAI
jgi:hypothetical protein